MRLLHRHELESLLGGASQQRASIVGGRAIGDFLVPSWRHIGDTQRSSVANVSRRGANCVGDGSTMGARRQRISIRPCRFLA